MSARMWRTRSPSTWHGRQNGPAATRGFGFTCGHFHKGWANNDQRKLVLNAILWTAKATVPASDVGIRCGDRHFYPHLSPLAALPAVTSLAGAVA